LTCAIKEGEIKESYDNEVQVLQQNVWKEHNHEVWLNIAAKLGLKYNRIEGVMNLAKDEKETDFRKK